MKIDVMLYDASPEMLRAIAEIAAGESVTINLSRKEVVTAIEKGLHDNEPKTSSTTQDTPLGKEGTVFAAPKQAVDPDAPKRGRGRPPKNPVVTMPNGVVLNAPVVEAEPEPTDVSVMEPEPEPVKAEPTPEDTIKAYFDRFKVAGFRALLNREGVAKFGELTDGRREVCLTEMRDALEMDVPVVAA